MKNSREWILASHSPRRQELLARIHACFRVVSPEVEEWEPPEADPAHMVEENAKRKGQAVANLHPHSLVIAADTTVALGKRIFGKPDDLAGARAMLRALSGRVHHVYTGIALFKDGHLHTFHESSLVHFRQLDEDRINDYLDRVHVLDKAGAYAIQKHGDLIIDRFEGTFENIMGLPIQRLSRELVQLEWVDPFDVEN